MNKTFKILLALFTCLLVLSACGKKKDTNTNETISGPKPSLSDALNTSGISLEKYQQIKYTSQQLHGGSNYKKVVSLLGNPSQTTDTTLTNNAKAKQYTWKMGSNAQLQYIFVIVYNDKVLSKGYQQNTAAKIVKKAKIEKIAKNTSFSDVQATLGSPLSQQEADGMSFMTYQYDNSHAYNLTFKNNKLSQKQSVSLNTNN
ncbi:hypothetical protein AKUA1404_13920 [Apilactobacillus kunkeei]|nr:hypothetical protein AKUA1404_13920 [Apilactobacillus kunkeei]